MYAKKTWRSLTPFGTMRFGLTKPKFNFLATTKGLFGEKGWSLSREEHIANCESWRYVYYALGLCCSWGHRKYCASGRKNGFHQISRNSRIECSKVSPEIEVEERYSSRTMILSIPQNLPWSTSRKDGLSFWNAVPRLDPKHAIHARRPKNISELEVPGKIGKNCPRSYKGVPKLLYRAFIHVLLFWSCKKNKLTNLALKLNFNLKLHHLEVTFVH